MKKRIASLFCLISIGISTLSVYASDSEIMPMAEACGKCPLGKVFYTYKDNRNFTTAGGCSHGLNGIDTGWTIYQYYRAKCSTSGCDADTGWIHYNTQYIIECNGE